MMDADESKFILRCDKSIEPLQTDNVYRYCIADWNDHLDDVAFVNTADDHQLTYRELSDLIEKTANDLALAGVCRGSVVSVWCANCMEMMIVALAIWRLEAIITLIGPTLTVDEARRQIIKVRSSHVFSDGQHLSVIEKMFQQDSIPVMCAIMSCKLLKLHPANSVLDRSELKQFDPDISTAVIFYSSGTTGFPKAVELTHTNMTCCLYVNGTKVTDRAMPPAIHFLPLSHFYGFTLVLRAFNDCSIVYLMSRFSIQEYVRLIQKYQIPVLFLVPPVAVMLTKRPDLLRQYDLSCVLSIFCSAAPLPPDVEKELATMLPGLIFTRARQSYGMTETTGAVTRSTITLGEEEPTSAVGKVLPLMEIKIVDEDTGKACGPNVRGELAVRGPLIMKGYYDDVAATDAMIDRNGWLRTGDIAYYDDEGHIFIVDRAKELIKYKGMQVAPAELENILLSHPEVADTAVVGLPDQLAGELPLAFVVRQAGSVITEKELQKYVAERVAVYKQLTGGVRFTDLIPKLPSGKILRRKLRESLNPSMPAHKL